METPLFTDPLAMASGAWPVQAPTASDTYSAEYVDGAYWLRGEAGKAQWAVTSGSYGAAAVEVTTRELTASGSGDVQGVGLTLRASADGANAVYFVVTPDGIARLWLYHAQGQDDSYKDWQYLAGQSDPAIHTGVGAWNRLLVVMRGGLYLCYVNDTLIITYYDQGHNVTAPPTPHTG
jgi:hypothetical protein